MTNYKGFELFSDIEDTALRNRNRAVVLTNLAVDNTKNRLISPKGAALILGYFQQVPEEDRNDVRERFKKDMYDRGYILAAS
ncbi:hypothetical protein KW787_04105 [Candidatus Pacearchaeota archaeon]|nr:hypothetical protein [Candidatus Pacearchaeota archaeon]